MYIYIHNVCDCKCLGGVELGPRGGVRVEAGGGVEEGREGAAGGGAAGDERLDGIIIIYNELYHNFYDI